jgi:hypothetical protein
VDCQRCGGEIVRRRTGPEGYICERCYQREYLRRRAAARRIAQLEALVEVVASVAGDLDREIVLASIERAAPSETERKRLLACLRSETDALQAGSPHAPKVVGRLASELAAAGASGVVRPACPGCGREVELVHPTSDGSMCARCYQQGRASECGLCGKRRPIITRTPEGLPMCSSCRNRDQARWEPCVRCRRSRPVNARTEDGGSLCNSCYRQPPVPCDGCGKPGIIVSRKGGRFMCTRCYRHPRRPCGRCGRVRRVALRATVEHPDLCPACHWAAEAVCVRCGEESPSRGVRWGEPVCLRCIAIARLDEVITAPDGTIAAPLRALRDVFVAVEQPRSTFVWLDRSPGVGVLRDIASGRLPLTHEALDALPQTASVHHLRQLLVAAGALPQRDPNLARLERALDRVVESLGDPSDRKLLQAFARWGVLRRARSKADRDEFSVIAAKNARTLVAEAAHFLSWLRERGSSLAECRQADIDLWLATGVSARRRIGVFLRWAQAHRAIGDLDLPDGKTSRGAPRPIDAEARWAIARRLIHDETLDSADRVVGVLVVLYAQPVTRIAKLRRSDVVYEDGETYVRLGKELMPIAEPLGQVLRELPWRRQVGPSGKVEAASEWLFPGRQAGLHLHPEYLRRRLGELGIVCRASRNAALLQLGGQLPAAVIADKLNVHRSTADRWVKMAGGDWARYAAERAQSAGT